MTTQSPAQSAHPYIGSREKLLEGDRVVTGQAQFVSDISLAGMLHAALVRSPHPHAKIRGIDTTRAERAPGVVRIVTGAEAKERLNPMPHYIEPAVFGGKHADIHCLATDKVNCVGQPVVAVVGTNLPDVLAALKLVKVDYEPLPHVLDAEEAMQPEAPRIVDGWDDNVLMTFGFASPGIDEAFDASDERLSATFKIPRFSTQPIETRAYLADYDARAETITLHATAQNPHPLRTVLAGALGFPENQIRIIVPKLGGGFGLKMHGYPEEPLICLLSMLTGRPVRWVESREECLLTGGREQTHAVDVAFNKDGRVTALKDSIIGNMGAPSATPGWGMVFVTGLTMPCGYDIQNLDIKFSIVATNKSHWNACRGFGKETANYVMERIMDMVAQRLGMDPAEVRFKNFIPKDAFPYTTMPGLIVDSGDYEATLNQALDLMSYATLREEQKEARKAGRYLGIGVAYELTPEGGALPGTLVAGHDTSTVKVDPSGNITVLTGVTNPGGGNNTGIAQIVADELGADLGRVRVVQGDTEICPYGFGNFSGRCLTVGGSSAALAARDIREKMALVAGGLLEKDPKGLVFEQSRVRPEDSEDEGLSFQEVAYAVYSRTYDVANVVEPPLEATRTYRPDHISHTPDAFGRINPYLTFSNGAFVAVVDVDADTGCVKVLRFGAVHDCGVIINPLLVDGQTHGGAAFGIGAALGEEVVHAANGQPLTTSFKEYVMPRAADLPNFELGHNVTPSPYTLLGTKGAGEASVGGAMVSVANAVSDALSPLGVEINELPLKPPTVWRAIQAAKKQKAAR